MKNGNSSAGAAARPIDVSQDLRTVQGYLRERGLTGTLRELEKPAPLLFGTLIAFEWTLILVAMMLPLYVSPWLVPVSLLILGSRQSALVIFLHDAAHKHICESRKANDIVARYALALPLFEEFATYRKEHTDHHRWLGHGGNDPDYVDPAWFRDIAPDRPGAATRIYLTLLGRNLNAGTRLRFELVPVVGCRHASVVVRRRARQRIGGHRPLDHGAHDRVQGDRDVCGAVGPHLPARHQQSDLHAQRRLYVEPFALPAGAAVLSLQ